MKRPIHMCVYKSRQTQRGLSLIELMVAITIGLLILAALSTLFISQTNIRNELDKSNRMIDNGRYALELLSENIRVAGFYDNYASSGAATAVPQPCTLTAITNATSNINVLLHHVQGYNAATASSAIASPPCSITSLKNGSDILVLRRVSTSNILATAAVATTAYFQVTNCATDAPPTYKLARGSAGFTALHKKNCSTASDLRPFVEQTYFVSPDNVAGDGIPTLKRIELDPTGAFVTTPLVEGIEFMQVEYGLDTNSDGAADSYTNCSACTFNDWPNIVSIKAYIIARNIETTKNYTDTKTYSLGLAGTYTPASADHYKRHAYSQVIRLVNPSSRRETP